MIDLNLKNARILIVDDKQSNIDILVGLLEMQGYSQIKTTTDSRLVLSLFKSFAPDLILLDLMMPHLNGYQLMGQLKELIPQNTYLPVLVLTADTTAQAKQRALAGGAKDFVSKPFELAEVQLRIKNLLETRFLQQQLDNQNIFLEEKVKKRTAELENTIVELEIAKNRAEASDRLKTAFMNNISHEIRTPLNGILGFASFIIQPEITMEEKEVFFDILNQSGKRLINTVTSFMDISLIVSGNMEVRPRQFDVFSLLTSVHQNFLVPCTKKNLEFIMQFPDNAENIFLKTDEEMLQKSISYLVDNAIKFTSKGSIAVGLEIKDNEVVLFVKDTGVGISKEAQGRIFDIFMQEDVTSTRGYEGSGLGLSIAKGMMDLLGGRISLESAKNMGTTVFLTFPKNIITASVEPKNRTITSKAGKIPFILIAEDDDYSYSHLEILLNNENKILRAVNGREAVELCKRHTDLTHVLMDIKMPEMNGYEATLQIRQFNRDVVIIALTAFALSGDREKAIQAGCNDYIAKPVKKDELEGLIVKYFMK